MADIYLLKTNSCMLFLLFLCGTFPSLAVTEWERGLSGAIVNSPRAPDGSLWEGQQGGKLSEDRNAPWSSSTPPCLHFSQLIDWLLDAYWRPAGDLQRQEASRSTGIARLEETSPLTNPAFLLDLIIVNPFYIIVGWFFYFQLLTNWNSFPLNAPHSWAVVWEP